jgi:hypothetical protein
MKAEDLARDLLKHPDREVMIAIDPEGNGYRKVAEACEEFFNPATNEPVDPEYEDIKNAATVFILWPY